MSRVSMTWPELRRQECRVDGQPVHLSGKEAEMLAALLISPPDRVLEYSVVVEILWPDPDTQALTALKIINQLRLRLRRKGVEIETHHGRGMWIKAEARGGRPERRRDPVCVLQHRGPGNWAQPYDLAWVDRRAA